MGNTFIAFINLESGLFGHINDQFAMFYGGLPSGFALTIGSQAALVPSDLVVDQLHSCKDLTQKHCAVAWLLGPNAICFYNHPKKNASGRDAILKETSK